MSAAAVGDEVHVLLAEAGAQAEETVGHGVAAVGGFELCGAAEHVADFGLEGVGPEVRVFGFDLVDNVDTEVEVDRFVAQDVLILLGDADHFVAAAEREDLREAGVEPHAFEDDVEGDEVAEEGLVRVAGTGGEGGVAEMLRVLERPCGFFSDGWDLAIHVEELAFVEAEGFDDVLKGVRVDGFFEGLAQEILAALRVGEVAVDREHDVVGDEGLGGCEEAEIALDGAALVVSQAVGGFPVGDVGLHGDFGGHPVVVAAGEIFFPGPAVFEWEELVDVGAAVDHGFVVDADACGAALDVAETCGVGGCDVGGRGLREDEDGRGFGGFGPVEHEGRFLWVRQRC